VDAEEILLPDDHEGIVEKGVIDLLRRVPFKIKNERQDDISPRLHCGGQSIVMGRRLAEDEIKHDDPCPHGVHAVDEIGHFVPVPGPPADCLEAPVVDADNNDLAGCLCRASKLIAKVVEKHLEPFEGNEPDEGQKNEDSSYAGTDKISDMPSFLSHGWSCVFVERSISRATQKREEPARVFGEKLLAPVLYMV